MSGLASKWATEEELVNRAKTQDNQSRKHAKPKSSNCNINDTPKPLESKWANVSSEPVKTSTHKDNRNRFDDSSKFNKYGRKNRGKNDRKYGNESYGSLPSPPSTAENDASPNHSNNSHALRAGSGNAPRGPRAYKTFSNNRQEKHPSNKKVDHVEESDEERTVQMSKAGASFAARLGVPSKKTGNNTNNDNDFESTDGEVTEDEDDGFEDVIESEDDEEKDLPLMTDAGQSLASRLGIVSISKTKYEPLKAKQNVKQQLQPTQSNDPRKQPKVRKAPKGAYQTPKQKREEQAKKEQAEKERLQEQKDAKLKEEVRNMFSKLTSSSANWADLEDED